MIVKSLVAVLVSNIVFSKALGTSTLLTAAKNKKNLMSLSIIITLFSFFGSVISYPVDKFILKDNVVFRPLCYVVIISIVYITSLVLIMLINEKFFSKIKKYIHVSAFNCAVFGILMLNSQSNESFGGYCIFALQSGIGFLVAAYVFKVAYKKLTSYDVPHAMRGHPIILIYVGIISMALCAINVAV